MTVCWNEKREAWLGGGGGGIPWGGGGGCDAATRHHIWLLGCVEP